MKVIIPQPFNTNMLISTGFTESVSTWSAVATYVVGNRVVYPQPQFNPGPSSVSKIYECIGTTFNGVGIIGQVPDAENSMYWVEVKTSNTYAMFDNTINNQSISTGVTVTIDLFLSKGISGISFINSEFGSVDIKIMEGSFTGQEKYRALYVKADSTSILNWYEYSKYTYISEEIPISYTDLVNIPNTYLRIRLTPSNQTNQVKIGELIFGTVFDFGFTQRGITAGITDYSIKQVDDFGNVNFVERAFSKKFGCRVLVKNSNLNASQRTLYNLRATPAVWLASEEANTQESTIIFGYYKDFSCELTYPDYSIYNLEIEGLV